MGFCRFAALLRSVSPRRVTPRSVLSKISYLLCSRASHISTRFFTARSGDKRRFIAANTWINRFFQIQDKKKKMKKDEIIFRFFIVLFLLFSFIPSSLLYSIPHIQIYTYRYIFEVLACVLTYLENISLVHVK